jgi:hypothetical protein
MNMNTMTILIIFVAFGIFRNGSVIDSAGCKCASAQAVID